MVAPAKIAGFSDMIDTVPGSLAARQAATPKTPIPNSPQSSGPIFLEAHRIMARSPNLHGSVPSVLPNPQPTRSARSRQRTLPRGEDIAGALLSARPGAVKRAVSASEKSVSNAALTVARQTNAGGTTLCFSGDLEAATVAKLRDAAFTEIGLHPAQLRLDLTHAGLPDAPATEALITIGNVARMMGVSLCVRVSPGLAALLQQTLLCRHIPMETGASEGEAAF